MNKNVTSKLGDRKTLVYLGDYAFLLGIRRKGIRLLYFDLICDDIIDKILDEVFNLRKRRVLIQFKYEWYNRNPIIRRIQSGRRIIHEGRYYLKSDHRQLRYISYPSIYWVNGFCLYPISSVRYTSSIGLCINNGTSGKIITRCEQNGWLDEIRELTDDTIVKYLMDKEIERTV